jgi:hypothetical protein
MKIYATFFKTSFIGKLTNSFFISFILQKYFSLFITKNHQLTVEITLSLQKENTDKSQKVPTFFHSYSAHKLCAQSSIKKILFSSAIFLISQIFAGFQKVCCKIITLVFFVIFAFKSFVSIFKVSSISTKIGVAQV